MIKLITCFCLLPSLLLYIQVCRSQDPRFADSIATLYKQKEKENNLPDTERLQFLRELSFNASDPARALQYNYELIDFARKKNNKQYLYFGYFQLGTKKRYSGDYPGALSDYLTSVKLAPSGLAAAYTYIGMADVYNTMGNYADAKSYYSQGIQLLRQLLRGKSDSVNLASAILNESEALRKNKQYDSALIFGKEARENFAILQHRLGQAYAVGNIGLAYAGLGRIAIAEKNINEAISVMEEFQAYDAICEYLNGISDIELQKGNIADALAYAKKSLDLAEKNQLRPQASEANRTLAELYNKLHDPKHEVQYYRAYITYRDSLNDISKQKTVDNLQKEFEISRKQMEVDRIVRQKYQQKILLFASLVVLAIIIALLTVAHRSIRQRQKAYRLLSKEKGVTEQERDRANNALAELKRAQAHLIHGEKMASLGQLTAGIAHEIQNPLNFVTNFADLNTDLVEELKEENKKGNSEAVDALVGDILVNSEKIAYHGRRADAIVKGMLQHSRGGDDEKKLTNINALAEEYFRLAYHGIRAKDKSFNVSMETNFDPAVGDVNVMPQEIARVLLNLASNAFYAVTAKAKEAGPGYIPTVHLSTKKNNGTVSIEVRDNGTGIPDSIREKIFQPFYTTKEPGIGTGLGLYLSYEIIKSHGGNINVESREGEGTSFTIVLPDDGVS